MLVLDDFYHPLADLTYPFICLNFCHDFESDFSSNVDCLDKLQSIKSSICRDFCNLFEKLWNESKELFAISINFEGSPLIVVNYLSISRVLLEELLRNEVILDLKDERNLEVSK